MSAPALREPVSVLILAGGTGGHVFPALAVAERLRSHGAEVVWMGVAQGFEATAVPSSGFRIEFVRFRGLRGGGVLRWLGAPFVLARALLQALSIVRRLKPTVAIGMGGFVSVPGALAAWLLRVPLLVHEQNAIPGLANQLLCRFATLVMEAMPGSFPASRLAVCTGNPVRESIAALEPPERRYSGRYGPLRILVMGGSQGAARLNETVPRSLQALPGTLGVEVRHQTGERHLESTRELYRSLGVEATVCAFIDDMSEAYRWADLVVCRAGAMTVAELAAAGVPAVLVPLPHAADDHQSANARFLCERGAATLIRQCQLEPERLAHLFAELGGARERLLEMATKARASATPDAADRVASLCLEVAGARA